MPANLHAVQSLIDRADAAYYRPGRAQIISDAEYDALKQELRTLNPNDHRLSRVGAPYDPAEMRNKETHELPMGSLDNTDGGIDGYAGWYQSVCKALQTTNVGIMASLKIDGGSIDLRYEKGVLVRATTRGDGMIGENVTANASRFRYVPTVLPEPLTLNVRGEGILYQKDFNAICDRDMVADEDRSNARNVGNGILGRSDGQDSEHIRFLAFNCYVDGEESPLDEGAKLGWLKDLGFAPVPHRMCNDVEDVVSFYEHTLAGRDQLPFEIDGVVVKVSDPAQRATFITADPKSLLRPKFARAIKFPHKSNETVLEGYTLTIGHTGAMIPTAKLQEVRVGGVNVTNALLNNWNEIERLGVQLGDTVEVILAGDIIPKITRVVKEGNNRQPIPMPTHCPCCGTATVRATDADGNEGAAIMCPNGQCPDILRAKIDHWIGTSKKGVGILGIGDAVLAAMWDQGLVRDPADLYALSALQLQDLPIGGGGRLGESRANSIVAAIDGKRKLPLHVFLGSIGIDLLGRRRVQQLQQAANGKLDTLEDWLDDANLERLDIQGFGPTIRAAVRRGIDANRDLIAKLLQGVTIDYPQAKPKSDLLFEGLSFCFTGTRDGVAEVERLGGCVKSGISKGLSFLVQLDPTSSSTKTRKAEAYGTTIISVDYLKRAIAGEVQLEKK